MDLSFSPEEEAFRAELRAYLARTVRSEWREPTFWTDVSEDEGFEIRRNWEAQKAADGFAGISWPVEYGGRGGTPGMKAIYDEEMVRARAPVTVNGLGLMFLAPTVMALGTEEQKQAIIGPLLRNEVIWCQGFSEPDAGSDLAGVRTTGVRDGEEYVVNGQKIWTTQAKYADQIFALVRTSPGSSRHEGLSMLLMNMHQVGIEARPLYQMNGQREFCEVFFTDARVSSRDCLGGIGHGWQTAMLLLSFERGASGFGYYTEFRDQHAAIAELSHRVSRGEGTADEDPVFRQALARNLVELECLKYHAFHVLTQTGHGRDLGAGASITKLQWSHAQQQMWEVFDDMLGPEVTVRRPLGDGIDLAYMQAMSMFGRSVTIWGGSTQVQRNIVAERVLGLPR